jgi:UPF0755 protein
MVISLWYIYNYSFLNRIYLPIEEGKEFSFEIAKGEGAYSVAEKLYKQDIIVSATYFKLLSRNSSFKVGEYSITEKDDVKNLIKKFDQGLVKQSYITFPEGSTVKQIKNIFKNKKIKGSFPKNIEEGSLFPNTYAYTKKESIEDIVKNMSNDLTKQLDELWEARDKEATKILKTKEEALILASIVERETLLKEEKPIVASVFLNRLNKRIKLQADSTVVYFVTKGLGDMKSKKHYKKHLERKNPYNTYMNYGLPPKPICNVGRDALEAVMNPAKTDFIFFVADGEGGHIFAKTLKEHNKNVAQWRKKQKSYDLKKIRK